MTAIGAAVLRGEEFGPSILTMLNSEIEIHSSHFPAGFRREFDAHVYYTPETRRQAERLRALAAADFQELPVFVGDFPDPSRAWLDAPVGPHPLPMFEVNFPRELLGQVLLWLLYERQGLTVLVHEVTGNDPRDHSAGAIWLGERLALDESKFDPPPTPSQPERGRT